MHQWDGNQTGWCQGEDSRSEECQANGSSMGERRGEEILCWCY